MGMVLEQGILDKRHKYTGIDMSLPMVGATPKIPSAAFNQTKATWSHDWKDIAGYTQSPDYYSPSAQFNAAHYTDLAVQKAAAISSDGFSAMEKVFCGCIFDAAHNSFAASCVFVAILFSSVACWCVSACVVAPCHLCMPHNACRVGSL